MDMTKRMARYWALCGLLFGVLVTGCDTIDRTQFRIGPPASAGGTAASQDREAIKAALQPFAARFKLQDITGQSLIPNVIVHYQQLDTTTPMKLVAWESNGGVLVDLFHEKPEPGESLAYQRARDELHALLRKHFRDQVTLVPFRQESERRQRFRPEQ